MVTQETEQSSNENLNKIIISSATTPQDILSFYLAQETKAAAWLWNLSTGDFQLTDNFFTLLNIDFIPHTNITQILQPLLSTDDFFTLRENILHLRDGTKEHIKSECNFIIEEKKTEVIFSIFAVKLEGEVVQLVGVIKLKKTEDISGKLGKITREVMERTKYAVLIVNEDLEIKYCNESAEKGLAYLPGEIVDKIKFTKIDIENSPSDWKKYLERARQRERVASITSLQRKDTTVFPVEVRLSYHRDDSEDLYCLIIEDMTERRLEDSILKPSIAEQQMLTKKLREERNYFKEQSSQSFSLKKIITASKKYEKILTLLKRVAPTDATVLILGETGTGKELLAQAVHDLSRRNDQTLIKVNCANLPKELIESELFGHEKGAFTGADKQKLGRFELANKGTIFLDEIGEMPLQLQTRLLRVLQEGQYERVGGTQTLETDVRIVAATNRNLIEMISEGTFRQDLYYRLHVFPINNMPLRERKEDIEVLAVHFLKKYSRKSNRKVDTIKRKDMERLQSYDFPGNIRELENIIERSVILTSGNTLNLDFWSPNEIKKTNKSNKFETLEELQTNHILKALERTKWRVSGDDGAAILLGVKDQTLFSRMRKFGIERK